MTIWAQMPTKNALKKIKFHKKNQKIAQKGLKSSILAQEPNSPSDPSAQVPKSPRAQVPNT
jgi:hypothetical protein